jgi:hypothetical protein
MSARILEQLLDAARVIHLTPAIRHFLQNNDPKALEQLERAIGAAEDHARTWNKPRRQRAETRRAFLERQVAEQRAWIQRCGGDLHGYITHYGDPGLERCYGNGGTQIYQADKAELEKLELALELLK